jgi:hypothetical protein
VKLHPGKKKKKKMVLMFLMIDARTGERFVKNYERGIEKRIENDQVEFMVEKLCKEFKFQ